MNGRLSFNAGDSGMYSVDRLAILQPMPGSACPAQGCQPCLGLPADLKYYFEPGDIVINGIFSLHEMGANPISCGGQM